MKIKIIGPALFACIALVQGCATPLQQITHEETTRVISYYTSLPASSQSKREVTEWVQADNKLEECKFFMGGDDPWWNEDGSSNFWDGDCKNGYAYGTGREFSTSNKHGKANTLSVYSGGEIPPKYYTAELNDKKVFIEGDISKVGVSGNIIEVIDDLGLFNIKVTRGTVSKAGSFMEKVDLRSSEKRRVKVYPNGFSYVFLTDNDPTADLQFSAHTMLDNNYVGFAINKYRSGAVEHISMLSGQPVYVSLPQSYLNHLQMVENEIDAKIQESEQKTKISDEVMATYKSRVCQGKPHFDFVTDEIYGMVCLEAGPLRMV